MRWGFPRNTWIHTYSSHEYPQCFAIMDKLKANDCWGWLLFSQEVLSICHEKALKSYLARSPALNDETANMQAPKGNVHPKHFARQIHQTANYRLWPKLPLALAMEDRTKTNAGLQKGPDYCSSSRIYLNRYRATCFEYVITQLFLITCLSWKRSILQLPLQTHHASKLHACSLSLS